MTLYSKSTHKLRKNMRFRNSLVFAAGCSELYAFFCRFGLQNITNALNRSQARWDANTWAASLRSYFSPCVIALYAGVIYLGKLMKSRAEKFTHNKSIKYAPSAPDARRLLRRWYDSLCQLEPSVTLTFFRSIISLFFSFKNK